MTIYRKKKDHCKEKKNFKFPKVINCVSNNPSLNHRVSQNQQQLNFNRSGGKQTDKSMSHLYVFKEKLAVRTSKWIKIEIIAVSY